MENNNDFDLLKEENTWGSNGFNVNEALAEALPEQDIEETKNPIKEIFEWLEVAAVAVISVVLIFSFVFRIATISGDSMLNTLHSGEKVVITNLAYKAKQGDIVVISRNIENAAANEVKSEGPIIKRVIAVGGQTVNIDFSTGSVYVDGKLLKEDYLGSPTINKADVEFPLYIPEGCIFVLGDNRLESLDSRYSQVGDGGIIDERYILGHAVFRIFPFDSIGRLDTK